MFLWDFGIHLPYCKTQHPRKPQMLSSLLWNLKSCIAIAAFHSCYVEHYIYTLWVGIAQCSDCYGLNYCGMIPGRGGGVFPPTAYRLALRTTCSPIQWIPGPLSLGIKWLGCEADHSPPSNATFNVWNYISTPSYVFMEWCLVKHRMCLHGMVLS
jgi:hypothetical protein